MMGLKSQKRNRFSAFREGQTSRCLSPGGAIFDKNRPNTCAGQNGVEEHHKSYKLVEAI